MRSPTYAQPHTLASGGYVEDLPRESIRMVDRINDIWG